MQDDTTAPPIQTGPPPPDAATQISRLEPVDAAGDWLYQLVGDWPTWSRATVIIAFFAAMAFLAHLALYVVLKRITRSQNRTLSAHFVRSTSRPARALLLSIGLAVGFAICSARGVLAPWLERVWPDAATVAIVLSVTWLIVGVIAGADDMILAKHRMDVRDNLRARRMHTQVAVISRFMRIAAVIIGVAVAMTTFDGIQRIGTSLLASAGIAGIAIGFAAKSVLGNLIAGIQIALTQPIRLDDAVVISGEWGWIEEITTTYVVVKIWDQRRLIVPFSKIIEEPFQNWTRNNSEILGSVEIYVDYSCDVDAVRAQLDAILEDNARWDKRAKVVQATDATERTVKLRVLVTAEDSPTAWDLRCDVRERLIRWMQTEHPEWLPRERQINLEDASRTRPGPSEP